MKVKKAAIIGYGYMGEIRRKVIEANPCLELVGIFEVNSQIRSKITGCRLYDKAEDIFKDVLDIVFVCTPNSSSPELCIAGMNAGKHIFCEKPPGRDVKDIEDIIKSEKRNKKIKLMFGFNHRFHPGIIKARAIINSGRLGDIVSLRGVYGKSGGKNFPSSWRNDRSVSGGGILLDQGIHMLDLFLYFCNDFEQVKCFTSNSFWKFAIEDNAHMIMKNKSGQTASLHSSATLWKHTFKLEMILEEGYATVEGLLSKSGSYGRERLILGKRQFEDEAYAVGNPEEEITHFDRDLSWDLEVKEFLDCIDQDKTVDISSSQDALKVMKIIEKAYIDSQTYQEVYK
ncbi:MAG: Gfo/Idh/MocA family oxidoreductase [Candidatus Omnitrophica bacterium]|nr:Gfo/Idh/MocA family oxidoreductase [Candidatus Omnitrophota bacterium]